MSSISGVQHSKGRSGLCLFVHVDCALSSLRATMVISASSRPTFTITTQSSHAGPTSGKKSVRGASEITCPNCPTDVFPP